MTYLYYQTSTANVGGHIKTDDKTKKQWEHLANKENWRIVQLPNGYYQTEVSNPENNSWHDVTRRETMDSAEAAIDGSVDHFSKKLEATKGPKVVKTFKK
mgnify:FL=1